MTGPSELQPGYFGKVPTHGDFISRRLGEEVVEPLDRWLREGLAASREQLGQAWLDYYLHGPIWRFVVSGGLLGPAPLAGVLMPSVDKVGRYFPLAIAVALPAAALPFQVVAAGEAWFRQAEDLALGCLDEPFDLETFDGAVGDLGSPAPKPEGDTAERQSFPVSDHEGAHVCIQILAGETPSEVQSLLADRLATATLGSFGYWCTEGSVNVPAMARITSGLPTTADFALLLTPGQGLDEVLPTAASAQ